MKLTFNQSDKLQINGWFVGCINIEKAIVWGKEIRACTHKWDNSSRGVVILEENLVQMSLIITEILLFIKCDLGLHSQGQLISDFLLAHLHHFNESFVKIGQIIAEI